MEQVTSYVQKAVSVPVTQYRAVYYNEVRSSTAGRRCHSCCRNCSRTSWCSCKSLRDSVTNNSSSLGAAGTAASPTVPTQQPVFATSGSSSTYQQQIVPQSGNYAPTQQNPVQPQLTSPPALTPAPSLKPIPELSRDSVLRVHPILVQLFLHHLCGQFHQQQTVQRVLSETRMEHHCRVIVICRYSQVMDRQHLPEHSKTSGADSHTTSWKPASQKMPFQARKLQIKFLATSIHESAFRGRMLRGGSRRIRLQPFQHRSVASIVTNAEIASIFDHVADLLEYQGSNVFRVRAYRNAARLVQGIVEAAYINSRCE